MKLYATFEFEVKRGNDSCKFTAREQDITDAVEKVEGELTEQRSIEIVEKKYNKVLEYIDDISGLQDDKGEKIELATFKGMEIPFRLKSAIVQSYYSTLTSLYKNNIDPEKKQ